MKVSTLSLFLNKNQLLKNYVLINLQAFTGGVRMVRSWNIVASMMFGGNRFLQWENVTSHVNWLLKRYS